MHNKNHVRLIIWNCNTNVSAEGVRVRVTATEQRMAGACRTRTSCTPERRAPATARARCCAFRGIVVRSFVVELASFVPAAGSRMERMTDR